MKSLSGGVDSFLGKIASAAGGEVVQGLFGRKDRMSLKDFKHNQNLLDYANPLEIAREQERLEKLTPTQAQAQNTFLEMTVPTRAKMDKQYADTMFPGTTAWERLGSGAAPTAMSPSPPAQSQASGFLTGLTPLITSKMAADTQLATTAINAQNAKEIAAMNNETAVATTNISTNQGQLPMMQTAQAKAQRLLIRAQEDTTYAQGNKIRSDVLLNEVASFLAALPEETVDLEVYKYSTRPGWQEVVKILGDSTQYTGREEAIQKALKTMRTEQYERVRADTLQVAGAVLKGGKAIGGMASSIGGFMKNMKTGKRK